MKKLFCILLAALLVGLSGCQIINPEDMEIVGDWPTGVPSTSVENIQMGAGEFAYYDGFIYFAFPGNTIAEVDLSTMKIATIENEYGTWIPNLSTDGEYLYIDTNGGGEGWYRISTDGKILERMYGYMDEDASFRYNDGTDSYYLKGGYVFCHEDLETHEITVIVDEARSYYLDDEYIYVVAYGERDADGVRDTSLLRTRRDSEEYEFEEIKLISSETGEKIRPINVIVKDGMLIVNEVLSYRAYSLDMSEVTSLDETYTATALPVTTLFFYKVGDWLVYKQDTFKGDTEDKGFVYAYNLKTGETEGILGEQIYVMCVLADRYVCIHTFAGNMCIFDLEKWEYLEFDLGEEEAPEDTAASEST